MRAKMAQKGVLKFLVNFKSDDEDVRMRSAHLLQQLADHGQFISAMWVMLYLTHHR
jgi:hypothetical protein